MTAPSLTYLDEGARQYRHALAHATRVGLTVPEAKAEIAAVLLRDTAAGRVTDWHGVCDRLTAAADRERAAAPPSEPSPSVTVIVPAREVSRG